MKYSNKNIYFIVSFLCLIECISLFLMFKSIESKSNISFYISNYSSNTSNIFAIMLEDDDGKYVESSTNKWPSEGYRFNKNKSACVDQHGNKINGALSYNENTNVASATVNKTSLCYLYFDKKDDIEIAVSGTTYSSGAKYATVNCGNASALYNNKYNRVEISNLNTSETKCTLVYSLPNSSTNFADYLTSLIPSGSMMSLAQGDGYLVDESHDDVTLLSKNEYKNIDMWDSSQPEISSSNIFTFNNGRWTNTRATIADMTYYFNFSVPSDGYYRICYDVGIGSSNNYIEMYDGYGTIEHSVVYASTDTEKSICGNLGYISADTILKVSNRTSSPISSASFSLSKINSLNTYDTGIRYEGKNPNNYIWFNNELWRIIGVFGSESHGISDTNLVKIIRDETIGALAWDSGWRNWWAGTNSSGKSDESSLYSLLNGAYYDWNSNKSSVSSYCFGYGTKVPGNCNFGEKGIQDKYRDMIQNVTWYLGGASTNSVTVQNMYTYERDGEHIYSGNPISATGYIGLMYASDYGYSALSTDIDSDGCARSTNLGAYDTASCAGKSWLYGQGYEWVISPDSGSIYDAVFISVDGTLSFNMSPENGYAVRPVLYLKNPTNLVAGSGTYSDPYIIGMQ